MLRDIVPEPWKKASRGGYMFSRNRQQTFSEELAGTTPNATWDRDLARLASATYRPDDQMGELPQGWRQLKPSEYPEGIVDREEQATPGNTPLNHSSKFRACLFKHDSGRHVMAFRGTKTTSWSKAESACQFVTSWANDLAVNVGQSVGLDTKQYELALNAARNANATLGGNIVFTGHSLGGGLAAAASVYTGNSAVTFNPAGVHDRTIEQATRIPNEARATAARGTIRTFIVEGDGLDGVQQSLKSFGIPSAPGAENRLDHPRLTAHDGKGRYLHGLEATISAMDNDMEGRFHNPSWTGEMWRSLARSQSGGSHERREQMEAIHQFAYDTRHTLSTEQAATRAVASMAHGEHRIRHPGEKLADHRVAPQVHFARPEGLEAEKTRDSVKQYALGQIGESSQDAQRHHIRHDSELAAVFARTGRSPEQEMASSRLQNTRWDRSPQDAHPEQMRSWEHRAPFTEPSIGQARGFSQQSSRSESPQSDFDARRPARSSDRASGATGLGLHLATGPQAEPRMRTTSAYSTYTEVSTDTAPTSPQRSQPAPSAPSEHAALTELQELERAERRNAVQRRPSNGHGSRKR
jgi:hypothetical protein